MNEENDTPSPDWDTRAEFDQDLWRQEVDDRLEYCADAHL